MSAPFEIHFERWALLPELAKYAAYIKTSVSRLSEPSNADELPLEGIALLCRNTSAV